MPTAACPSAVCWMINTHLHRGTTVDTGSEHSPGQSLCSFKQHIHKAIQPHLLSMKPSSKQTHGLTHKVAILRHTETHSFQASVYVVIDGVIYGQLKKKKKNGNAEKTAVCLQQLNMQQLWGTVRKGLGGTEWCLHVCVAVCWTVWLHVCVWANAMG